MTDLELKAYVAWSEDVLSGSLLRHKMHDIEDKTFAMLVVDYLEAQHRLVVYAQRDVDRVMESK